VVNVNRETLRLGGCANVAENLKHLTAHPVCIGLTGLDESSRLLRQQLKGKGIDTRFLVKDPGRPTTVKTRIIAHSQQVVRIDKEKTLEVKGKICNSIVDHVKSMIKKVKGIIVSDYGKGVVTKSVVKRVVRIALDHNVFVAVDPKERHFSAYKGVSIITPNQKEAEGAVGFKITDNRGLERAGKRLLEDISLEGCLITLGERGMALFDRQKKMMLIPTVATDVFDVTGAGDTVISAFTAAVCGNASFAEAAVIANYAAGLVIREVGAASVSPRDIEKAMFG
jgi:D-beta-D-heptose 7-phosphate kinase/D-beta-D-heptose 1-phosphate adenosyltransferase